MPCLTETNSRAAANNRFEPNNRSPDNGAALYQGTTEQAETKTASNNSVTITANNKTRTEQTTEQQVKNRPAEQDQTPEQHVKNRLAEHEQTIENRAPESAQKRENRQHSFPRSERQ